MNDVCRSGAMNYSSYTPAAAPRPPLGADWRTTDEPDRSVYWTRFRTLLDDLLSSELDALAGRGRRGNHFRCDIVGRRTELLKALAEKVGLKPTCSRPMDQWAALPWAVDHDETFLLRAAHLSECCWRGAAAAVVAALDDGGRGDLTRAADGLMTAAAFVEALLAVSYIAKKTAPVGLSPGFRLAVDTAGAVTSRGYGRLQMLLEGDAADGEAAGLCGLRRLLKHIRHEQSPGAAALRDAATVLGQALDQWRRLRPAPGQAATPAPAAA